MSAYGFVNNQKSNHVSDNVEKNLDDQLTQLTTTSAKIRYLTALGWNRSRIAKKLDILYQHVRNVQITPLKKLNQI